MRLPMLHKFLAKNIVPRTVAISTLGKNASDVYGEDFIRENKCKTVQVIVWTASALLDIKIEHPKEDMDLH